MADGIDEEEEDDRCVVYVGKIRRHSTTKTKLRKRFERSWYKDEKRRDVMTDSRHPSVDFKRVRACLPFDTPLHSFPPPPPPFAVLMPLTTPLPHSLSICAQIRINPENHFSPSARRSSARRLCLHHISLAPVGRRRDRRGKSATDVCITGNLRSQLRGSPAVLPGRVQGFGRGWKGGGGKQIEFWRVVAAESGQSEEDDILTEEKGRRGGG